MYKCEDCGELFMEPENLEETHEHFGTPCHEEIECCPHCQSTEYFELFKCPECGEETEEEGLCKTCRISTIKKFRRFFEALSEAQQEFLEEKADGIWLSEI